MCELAKLYRDPEIPPQRTTVQRKAWLPANRSALLGAAN